MSLRPLRVSQFMFSRSPFPVTTGALVLTCALVLPAPLRAGSVVTVTTESDNVLVGDGECSIAEAFGGSGGIQIFRDDCDPVVNGDSEPLVIRLQPAATYLRSESLNPDLGSFQLLEVEGRGATVARNPAATDLFSLVNANLPNTQALTLRDLTLRDGQAERSAGLEVSGSGATVQLERVRFVDNQALGSEIGQGTNGALGFSGSSIHIVDCLFDGNNADRFAGAVNLSSVDGSITSSEFVGNTSGGGAGALRVSGSSLRIVRTTFDRNIASTAGGAIDVETNPALTVEQCTFSGNLAEGFPGRGGAIDISGSMSILHSLFTGNSASGEGGAIYKAFPLSARVMAENSTFFRNTAGGSGGAVHLDRGVIELTSVTVVGNEGSDGGGVFVASNPSTGVTLDHSIVAGNTSSRNVTCVGPRNAEGGFSLLGSQCGFSLRPGDQFGAEAAVVDSELRDNGGPTLTLAVTPNDAAHNAGSREYLQTTLTDQRGFPRIAEGRVDVGAHEFAAGAVDGFIDVVLGTSFEDSEPRRFFDRQQFQDATGAVDVVGPYPNSGTVTGEARQGPITFVPLAPSSLNFGTWTNALPDLGGPGGSFDLALNDLEQLDLRSETPITAFGFDFVDPDSDATPFNLLACASTFDPNSANCPVADIVFSMDFSAGDASRLFVGFQVPVPIQQVSIREQTNSNTNEYFGHVFTAP
ncbi:MAG: choice-of-anchor Q domain-containing protein [Cyanobacteria bacterium P01_D01_bin.123]